MEGNSRSVVSNQTGCHKDLDKVVRKHLERPFAKPCAAHSLAAFEQADAVVRRHGGAVILDACCGVGQSSALLARRYPEALVIGVDKSAHRLAKYAHYAKGEGNSLVVRADLNDFYRLALAADWPVARQFLLYPNPWPKARHLMRRWHGAPVFPCLVRLGGMLEVRSNWRLYLEEFARALELCGVDSELKAVTDAEPLTPFERKYRASGQFCYRLLADLDQHQLPQ